MSQPDGWSVGPDDDIDRLFAQLVSLPEDSAERANVRDRLIELNLPLVKHLARRYSTWNLSIEDATQIGSVGLIKAVDGFDPALGHAFASYAVPKIVGEIRRFLRDSNWLVRVPRRSQELQSAVANARDALTQDLGRPPTISEIAQQIGASANDVVEVVESFRNRVAHSIDAAGVDETPDSAVQSALRVEEGGFEAAELLADLHQAMATLTEDERAVILRRFGAEMSQSEIAAEIGVSQMQVSRVLRRSLERMRRRMSE
ncbi:MAG: SigB/SigF/SigG family RNA polymerase sigma factor [Nocardioides sp.]